MAILPTGFGEETRRRGKEQVVEQQLPIIDCLIFAYTNTAEGEIDMILLATVYACDIPP